MVKYFCNGKRGFCNNDTGCVECKYTDGSGGEWRTAPLTNYEYITSMTCKQMSEELLPLIEEIMEDGVPSKEWMFMWLDKPYGADDAV